MTVPPDSLTAALADRYRIERQLGEGGMATVYLADDLKHDRKVALKVLKPELAAVVGADRFVAEIRTTANLRHPHILPLFDSGEADGFLYYVMPYVEGESLRERLDRERELPVDEAVVIATKVAGALQAAHDAGVIHRDIKPANILLERGEPVVADFGIALAVQEAGGGRLTETGLSLGTPYYMSPEQATGDRSPDARSDVYALAAVLYEMLTGEPPHTGSSAQAVLGRILTEAPRDVSTIRSSVPPNVAGAVARALERLPADRFASAAEFAAALKDAGFTYGHASRVASDGARSPSSDRTTPNGRARAWIPWASTAVFAALSLSLVLNRPTGPETPGAAPQLTTLDLGGVELASGSERVEVSPRGDRFVFPGVSNGVRMLYVREAGDRVLRPLPGTEGAQDPYFSPGGEWIVFDSPMGRVSKVSVAGGAPRPVTTKVGRRYTADPSWTDDGRILFRQDDGLYTVSENGGTPERLVAQPLYDALLLPDAGAVVGTDRETLSIVRVDIATGEVRTLVSSGVTPSVLSTGHLVYGDAAGELWIVPFDRARAEPTGEAVPLGTSAGYDWPYFLRYSISASGTMVYTNGGVRTDFNTFARRSLGFVDLAGNLEMAPLPPGSYVQPRWSPEGDRIAYHGDVRESGSDIYVWNRVTMSDPARLTVDGANERPVWSPDGTRLVFASVREGTEGQDLFVREVDTDAPPRLLISLPGDQLPSDWPRDDLILFVSGDPEEIWTADLSRGDSVTASRYLAADDGPVSQPRLRPGGDWVAYGGTPGVGLRSFPTPRQPVVVEEGRGRPTWSLGGDTLFYWGFDDLRGESLLFLTPVDPAGSMSDLDRQLVARVPAWSSWSGPNPRDGRFIVSPEWSRSPLIADSLRALTPIRHSVLTNWTALVEDLFGG